MASYPNRCQHIKVNGTQCGSPALRRNRFCFFHKSWHEQRIHINANRARRARSISLPILEDANSIQVALMQVMRLIVAKEIDSKTAGLLLYALQTASVNLRSTRFEPVSMHEVVLDPRDASGTPLGVAKLWSDDDFEEDEEDQEAPKPRVRRAKPPTSARPLPVAASHAEEESDEEEEEDPGRKPSMPDMSQVRKELSDLVIAHAPDMLAPLTVQQLDELGLPRVPLLDPSRRRRRG
jgi:hypothetical protein